ncbi:MAG TPA: ABC transporter permease subunit [Armatimonadetes bacterium]|nr:ABC transporter permease subunit [Armatimonadota bacterium]
MEEILHGFARALHLLISGDAETYNIIGLSLAVSGLATLIAALLGITLGTFIGLREFFGRQFMVTLLSAFMGLPPVVVGLLVYLILSRSGPLGVLGLLFTPTAMVIAQVILATPIIAALTCTAVAGVDRATRDAAVTLGANEWQVAWLVLGQCRPNVVAAVMAGFGRVIAEVGAVMLVGGNIRGSTRVMTTAIVLATNQGQFDLAIALGLILLTIAFLVNLLLSKFQLGNEPG